MLNQRDDYAYQGLQYYEQLLRFSMGDFATVPNIAKAWEVSGWHRLYVPLREGIRWSDP